MPLIDPHGRVFSRFNLVDTVVLLLFVVLLPIAYAAALLMRPSRPQIESVTRAEMDNTDRRITRGTVLAGKFKIRGSGLTPMLRANIGNTSALAFVFEHPNSADVLVGGLPPGAHDLVLFDGVQEVARAVGAVVIESPPTAFIRLSGWASGDSALMNALVPGFRFPDQDHVFEVFAAGPPIAASTRISIAGRQTDLPRPGHQRQVVLLAKCDPSADGTCSVGGTTLGGDRPVAVDLPAPNGSLRLAIDEVFPAAAPASATVTVAFRSAAATPAINDRDQLLDQRAAIVRSVSNSGADTLVTVTLGADRGRDGWRYRGRPLKSGAPFTLTTESYVMTGEIRRIVVADEKAESR